MAKLANVNTTDIRAAIELGCQTMQNVFNADDNDKPFFLSHVWPDAKLEFQQDLSDAHVPGRHLNALLNAEDVAGVAIDEEAIRKHASTAYFSYSGPIALPLNRAEQGGPPARFMRHNIREGFHALTALVKYRHDEKARELAEACIDVILKLWNKDPGFTPPDLIEADWNFGKWIIGCEARAIGPLVKYYRATGYGPALELAIVMKEKAVSESFLADGSYDRHRFGQHTHSVTCTMSSLAQLADLTCDLSLMEHVRVFYDHGLWDMRDELGWVIEFFSLECPPDRGEGNNTGDIVETALILGRWGYPQYYEDAEQILRGHLLPSQLRDVSFIEDLPNPDNIDGLRDVANRNLGAFGFPAPYGHRPEGANGIQFHLDIVGGVVGSLCEVLREATCLDEAGHWVNLLFDHETDAVRVTSPYTHDGLTVTLKKPGPLFVRIPPWVDRGQMVLPDVPCRPRFAGGYMFFPQPPVGKPIPIGFDLPVREMRLKHRTHDIRVRLRGNEVVAMDNFGMDWTYFDPYED